MKRSELKSFVSSLDLFKSVVDEYQLNKICDAFERETRPAGSVLIREGDSGDAVTDFFVVVKGSCFATKTLEPGKAAVRVMDFGVGDYFGERALIKNEARAASVIA